MNDPLHALRLLYEASSRLRIRVQQSRPAIMAFSDWQAHTKAMQDAETVLREWDETHKTPKAALIDKAEKWKIQERH